MKNFFAQAQSICLKGLLAVLLFFAGVQTVRAANVWDGGGADNNWNTKTNWDNNVVPSAGAALTFAGTTRLAPNNNLAAGTDFANIAFDVGAGGFTLGGNQVKMTGLIQNNSTNAQTIHMPIYLDAGVNLQLYTLVGSGDLTLSGVISGPGSIYKSQLAATTTLILSGDNTYSGSTAIWAGNVSINSIKTNGSTSPSSFGMPAAGNGTIHLSTASPGMPATLIYTGTGDTTDRGIDIRGGGNPTLTQNGSGLLKFTGPFTVSYDSAHILTLNGSGPGEMASAIGNAATKNTRLVKDGAGTWILSGTNTYGGTTTVNSGTLQIGNGGAAGTLGGGDVLVAEFQTLAFQRNDPVSAPYIVTNTITGTGPSIVPFLEVKSGAVQLAGTNDNAHVVGIVSNGATLILAKQSSTSPNVHALGRDSFVLDGGTLQLAGTGGDQIADLRPLEVRQGGVFDLNARNETINTLSLAGSGIGGAGALINGSTAATSTLTVTSGITLTNDSSMGGAGHLLIAAAITGGSQGLAKIGTGTLTLNGANTYGGDTAIQSGTLALGSGGSLNALSSVGIAAGATFDVSATPSPYFWGSGATLEARGTGTGLGTTAAAVRGAPGGIVDLGVRPIALTYTPFAFNGDIDHPAFVVSAGTLSLGGNAFTIDNASGTPLGAGSYRLIEQASGTVDSSGSHTVSVTGAGLLVPGSTASISVSGGNVNLVISKVVPEVITPPTSGDIVYGQTLADSALSGGTGSVAGAFAFTTPSTAPDAGMANQSVTFTPDDGANYESVVFEVSVKVEKAIPSVTTPPTAADIVYGQTLADSTLSGGTGSVAGAFAFTTPSTAPDVGTANQSVTFTPDDAANYESVVFDVSVTVENLPTLAIALIRMEGSDAVLEWPGTNTWNYTVEFTTSLLPMAPAATLDGYVAKPGANGTMYATDTNDMDAIRYYRIRMTK
jgi:autotransporter-associated beta strand protein